MSFLVHQKVKLFDILSRDFEKAQHHHTSNHEATSNAMQIAELELLLVHDELNHSHDQRFEAPYRGDNPCVHAC
jgi:hypothetical protein